MKAGQFNFYSLATSTLILFSLSQNLKAQESYEEVRSQNLEISLDCSDIGKETQDVSLQATISGKMRGIAITGWTRRDGGLEAIYGPSSDYETFKTKVVIKTDLCDEQEVKLSSEELLEKAKKHLEKEYRSFRNPKISEIKLEVVSKAKTFWPSKRENRSELAKFDLNDELFVFSSETISGYAGLFIVDRL